MHCSISTVIGFGARGCVPAVNERLGGWCIVEMNLNRIVACAGLLGLGRA